MYIRLGCFGPTIVAPKNTGRMPRRHAGRSGLEAVCKIIGTSGRLTLVAVMNPPGCQLQVDGGCGTGIRLHKRQTRTSQAEKCFPSIHVLDSITEPECPALA